MFNIHNWGCPVCHEGPEKILITEKEYRAHTVTRRISLYSDPKSPGSGDNETLSETMGDVVDMEFGHLTCEACNATFHEMEPKPGSIDEIILDRIDTLRSIHGQVGHVQSYQRGGARTICTVIQPNGSILACEKVPVLSTEGWRPRSKSSLTPMDLPITDELADEFREWWMSNIMRTIISARPIRRDRDRDNPEITYTSNLMKLKVRKAADTQEFTDFIDTVRMINHEIFVDGFRQVLGQTAEWWKSTVRSVDELWLEKEAAQAARTS